MGLAEEPNRNPCRESLGACKFFCTEITYSFLRTVEVFIVFGKHLHFHASLAFSKLLIIIAGVFLGSGF